MKQTRCQQLLLFVCLACLSVLTLSCENPLTGNALDREAEAEVKKLFAKCSDVTAECRGKTCYYTQVPAHYVGNVIRKTTFEYEEPSFNVEPRKLTEADNRNGSLWYGTVTVKGNLSRQYITGSNWDKYAPFEYIYTLSKTNSAGWKILSGGYPTSVFKTISCDEAAKHISTITTATMPRAIPATFESIAKPLEGINLSEADQRTLDGIKSNLDSFVSTNQIYGWNCGFSPSSSSGAGDGIYSLIVMITVREITPTEYIKAVDNRTRSYLSPRTGCP